MTDLSAELLPQLSLVAVSREELPAPARAMLDHARHMTHIHRERQPAGLTLDVLQTRISEETYSREVLLRAAGDGSPLQWAILTVQLGALPVSVTDALRAARQPFGQILTESGIERRIEVERFVRAALPPAFASRADVPATAFGREITIHCDEQPAVSVLELLLT